jgi:putative peptidoglycan lipid II flippase
LTAPGFDSGRFTLAVLLAQILYPLLAVNVLISFVTSALNARGAFVRPVLALAAVPLTIGISVFIFGKQFGIFALAWGEVAGFLIGLIVLLLGARAAGLRYKLELDWHAETLHHAARQSVPVLAGSALIHANGFIDQLVASALPPGELSALSYALKMIGLPVSVVFLAFSRVVLPHFSMQVVQQDWNALKESIRIHVWFMLGLTVAMTVGAILFARPVIQLLFERGRFGAETTDLVSAVVVAGALGLVPMGLGFIIPRVYNALQRNDLLTAITVFSLSANLGLDLLLAPRMGAVGIALATSLVYAGALAIQLLLLSRLLGGFNALGLPRQFRTRWREQLARARAVPMLDS